MQKFDKLSGVVAPLNILNIDTDMIIPKQFLKTIKRLASGSICSAKCAMQMMAVKTLILCSSQRTVMLKFWWLVTTSVADPVVNMPLGGRC